jgi:hypothetical protein
MYRMRSVAALCACGLLMATACTSSSSAPGPSARDQPTRAPVSAATSVSWPSAADARPDQGYPGQRQPYTVVPASAVSEQASSAGSVFGLADCGPFVGTAYPAVSHDGGQSWRVVGPELWRAAAQGAEAVAYVVASGPVVAVWGSSIVTSPDDGRTWWRTYLGQAVRTVVAARNGTLTALAQSEPAPGQPTLMQTARYRSSDGGRTWQLVGRTDATPAGPIGPRGSTHPTCG